MKNSEIRKLSAVTSAQVVPLGTRWRDDEQLPSRLRKRAKASDELFISKDGIVVSSDLRVGFLAERIETVCISHASGLRPLDYRSGLRRRNRAPLCRPRYRVGETPGLAQPRPQPP